MTIPKLVHYSVVTERKNNWKIVNHFSLEILLKFDRKVEQVTPILPEPINLALQMTRPFSSSYPNFLQINLKIVQLNSIKKINYKQLHFLCLINLNLEKFVFKTNLKTNKISQRI